MQPQGKIAMNDIVSTDAVSAVQRCFELCLHLWLTGGAYSAAAASDYHYYSYFLL